MALGLALPTITLAQDSGDARPPRRDGPPRHELNRDGGTPREGERRDAPSPRRDGIAGDQRGPGQDGPGEGRRPSVVPPLFAALDANHDGVIDKKEIKHAAKALHKLDKNDDGKLTPDELRPARSEARHADARPGRPSRDQEFARPRGDGPPVDGPRRERGPRPPQDR